MRFFQTSLCVLLAITALVAASPVKTNPKDGQSYVWVPPGTFRMGCSEGDHACDPVEEPSHRVTITKGFWIGQTEVTVRAYKQYATATAQNMPPAPVFNPNWKMEDHPVVFISWDQAAGYCRWQGGRLPTEAEWEYAARGGSPAARSGNLDAIAWYDSNSGESTHPVAQKRPNGFGLYDMFGNAWEWVADWYGRSYYANSPAADPPGPRSGQKRILRGNAWINNAMNLRVSFRNWGPPEIQHRDIGFRCVWEPRN